MLNLFDKWCSSWDVIVFVVVGVFFFVTGYRPPWWRRKNWWCAPPGRACQPEPRPIRDIPGPVAVPVLGTSWIYFWFAGYRLDKIHENYKLMFERYGDVLQEQALWNVPVISLKGREDIEAVLRQSSRYPLRPPTEVISYYRRSRPDRYASIGLVNEQGEAWSNLRSKLTPELTSAKTIAQFVPELNAIVDDFIGLLRRARDSHGVVHNLEELTNRMGLESTCALILGRRMGFLDGAADARAARLARAVQDHFCASRDTFYGLPFWKFWRTEAYARLTRSEDTIYSIISDLVDGALGEEADTCAVDAVRSVFVSMLQVPDLDVREKKAAIIDFIAAGIQTLGNTLVFLLHLVGRHGAAQDALLAELTAAGLAAPGDLSAGALGRAAYLRACIAECFRVLPTANCIARILDADLTTSAGFALKAGTVVLCHTGLACRSDRNFRQAALFRPERWLGAEAAATGAASKYLVVPFGAGRRMCPGKRFVKQELQLALAKIVREFHVEFTGDLDLQFEFLLAPKGPVRIVLRDRC